MTTLATYSCDSGNDQNVEMANYGKSYDVHHDTATYGLPSTLETSFIYISDHIMISISGCKALLILS